VPDDERRSFPVRGPGAPGAGAAALDYERVQAGLLRSINRVCPRWLADQREDLLQASLVRILEAEKRGELSPPVPASYLWKVAYSATVDRIRRLRRSREVPMQKVDSREVGADPRPGPFEERSLRDLGDGIRRCLDRLIPRRRLVLGFFLLGNKPREMEALTGWDGKKIRNLLHRGLAQLRECLADQGLTP
jgi:RNA polymerase sigma-70 factor (ECF subfamily)